MIGRGGDRRPAREVARVSPGETAPKRRPAGARGSSSIADAADLVLALRRPADWRVADGARVELHIDKARRAVGAALEPVLAHLRDDGTGRAAWHWQSASPSRLDRATLLLREGLDAPALGRALGVSRATAFRLQRQARQRMAGSGGVARA